MKKFIYNLIFSKIVFLHYLRRTLVFFGKKMLIYIAQGITFQMKTRNGPLHHHINVFSDNSIHWCIET